MNLGQVASCQPIEEWLEEGKIGETTARAMRRTVDIIRFDAEDMI